MSIEGTLSERGNRYGDFTHHAEIAQDLQNVMRRQEGWAHLDAVKKQALTVIADKIARILSGNPEYADNWHDIQGYAKLVEDRLGDDKQTLEMDLGAVPSTTGSAIGAHALDLDREAGKKFDLGTGA